MAPPQTPSVAWDVSIDRKAGNNTLMKPGTYWFAMTQRQQQTGWATPREVAQNIPYNPYSDPYTMSAKVATDPITFIRLPPENYKESFLSDVIEIKAHDPWNMATVRLGKDHAARPDYYMTTPAGQNAEPFPIASQTYYAFYISSDSGTTWKLYDTFRTSEAPSTFSSHFAANDYANPNTLNQAMGNLPDDVKVLTTKVFSKPPPTRLPGPLLTKPPPPATSLVFYALVGLNVILLLWILYCVYLS